MDPILDPVLAIEGGTAPEEVGHLFELAQTVRDGCIVEVGSFRGRSTAALALGSKLYVGAPVYAIEPHEEFLGSYGRRFGVEERAKFCENMLRVGVFDVVRLVNLSSEFVTAGRWPMPVGLLFIDGDHRYKAVRSDILSWLPHLRPNATVVFDDATDERTGPYHVVEELIRGGRWSRGPEVGKMKTLYRILDGVLDPATISG